MNKQIEKLIENAEKSLNAQFACIDRNALKRQKDVLNAFRKFNVGQRHFAPTNGYGYDDIARDTLCSLYADVFNAESAIVSPLIVSGTHALSLCLFGILRPGDTMLAVTGAPYDTLQEVINGAGNGSLADFGVKYREVRFDNEKMCEILRSDKSIKLVFMGRSRGYEWRNALKLADIAELVNQIRSVRKDVVIMCDNCYGEFVEEEEPTSCGVDIVAGSLIKNIGGGLAPTGGYICGKKTYVEQIAGRLTAPSIGMEVGSYAGSYRNFYQGLFLAPHVTACALKSAMLFAKVFSDLGYEVSPDPNVIPGDIICAVKLGSADKVIEFVRAIQRVSPIDSNVTPFPWDMPGYTDQVIMAAGTFVAGASIELSADSPIREPYIVYVQGAFTYEHAKIAVEECLEGLLNKD